MIYSCSAYSKKYGWVFVSSIRFSRFCRFVVLRILYQIVARLRGNLVTCREQEVVLVFAYTYNCMSAIKHMITICMHRRLCTSLIMNSRSKEGRIICICIVRTCRIKAKYSLNTSTYAKKQSDVVSASIEYWGQCSMAPTAYSCRNQSIQACRLFE